MSNAISKDVRTSTTFAGDFMRKIICFTILSLAIPTLALTAEMLSAPDAGKHIGEQATVCGVVASSKYAQRARGRPTFLNLDKTYPNPIFTILIWGDDRAKFGAPEIEYLDKRICVAGTITAYRGNAEMKVSDPAQIHNQ